MYLVSLFACSFSLNFLGNVPKSLIGRRIIMNGPAAGSKTSKCTRFDGNGIITSVAFKEDKFVISDVEIPQEEITFPLSDYMERDYLKIISKFPYTILGTHKISSGTKNTAVLKYEDEFYAVEETCKPMKLVYVDDIINLSDETSNNVTRMGAHLLDENTCFSYTIFKSRPIRFNNRMDVPWTPRKYPLLVHDGVMTYDKKMCIFPITSTGLGKIDQYINSEIDLPLDPKVNVAGFVVYDIEKNCCNEVLLDEYVDLFHISHIEHIMNNIHKLYIPFVYNFTDWVCGSIGDLYITLKEIIIDLKTNKIIDSFDTKIRMDFVNKYKDFLVGSSLTNTSQAIFYNLNTKLCSVLNIPGECVREIIPFDDMLMYFSHELNNTKTFLYVVTMTSAEIISKIPVPNRPPGYHTSFF